MIFKNSCAGLKAASLGDSGDVQTRHRQVSNGYSEDAAVVIGITTTNL